MSKNSIKTLVDILDMIIRSYDKKIPGFQISGKTLELDVNQISFIPSLPQHEENDVVITGNAFARKNIEFVEKYF